MRTAGRRFREARMFAKAMRFPQRPILAHIIPIRRCNLACAYCNEYDATSDPVPTDEMLRRVDRLASLGASIITLSGGEPLLHPQAEEIVRRIRSHGLIATLITNGYPLSIGRIWRLNRAGLDYLQVSIDNVEPDEASKKSLQVLEQRLIWLARQAIFQVTVNTALGYSLAKPEDALLIVRRAEELGFTSTVGIIHDHSGQLWPLTGEQRRIYEQIARPHKSLFSFAQYNRFQKNLARGLPNEWQCRAGCRYLYICEDGLVHWCSQQRGRPAVPLARYTPLDLAREGETPKPCAPFCTVSCVHQTALLDSFRERPHETLIELLSLLEGQRVPTMLKVLRWAFLTSRMRRLFTRLAVRVLAVGRGKTGGCGEW